MSEVDRSLSSNGFLRFWRQPPISRQNVGLPVGWNATCKAYDHIRYADWRLHWIISSAVLQHQRNLYQNLCTCYLECHAERRTGLTQRGMLLWICRIRSPSARPYEYREVYFIRTRTATSTFTHQERSTVIHPDVEKWAVCYQSSSWQIPHKRSWVHTSEAARPEIIQNLWCIIESTNRDPPCSEIWWKCRMISSVRWVFWGKRIGYFESSFNRATVLIFRRHEWSRLHRWKELTGLSLSELWNLDSLSVYVDPIDVSVAYTRQPRSVHGHIPSEWLIDLWNYFETIYWCRTLILAGI